MLKRSSSRKKSERGIASLLASIKEDRYSFLAFLLFVALTTTVLFYSLYLRHWHRVFMGALTLALLLIPALVERKFCVRLPSALEILAYTFIFCAGVLGEIAGFYERFSFWDDLLHAFNGYMFAAFGFCIVAIAERARPPRHTSPPWLATFVAFCFSMTVGAIWELFEYATDNLFLCDMQKDTFLSSIHSIALSGVGEEGAVHVQEITETVLITATGERITYPGFLDIGLVDTMLDLFVNMQGALIFCTIGYLYLRYRRARLARSFIPEVLERKNENKEKG